MQLVLGLGTAQVISISLAQFTATQSKGMSALRTLKVEGK
jgi:hypothetical protein